MNEKPGRIRSSELVKMIKASQKNAAYWRRKERKAEKDGRSSDANSARFAAIWHAGYTQALADVKSNVKISDRADKDGRA